MMISSPRPFRAVLDLFSSVRFGIVLLVLLFVYSSVGSAGILYPVSLNFFDLDNWNQFVVRQQRGIELTEYEWFHWWPFNLLIALICITLVVTTLRRIPFKPVNYGVWMIHTGIIVLALGSVLYFGTKFEGDVAVARRNVVVQLPGHEPQAMVARVGNRLRIGTGTDEYTVVVTSVDPGWELLTGDDAGTTTYAVSVAVRGPEQSFVRQLLAGYPQYTEDVIPGQGRAVKVTGQSLVDERLQIALAYDPQPYIHLVQSDALYIREVGQSDWVERPILKLPRYNEYLGSFEEVWPIAARETPPLDPLSIRVAAVNDGDPLPNFEFRVRSYLRYAELQGRRVPGGDTFAPYMRARLRLGPDEWRTIELIAGDPQNRSYAEGFAVLLAANTEEERTAALQQTQGVLTIAVGEGAPAVVRLGELIVAPEAPFRDLPGTGYAWRVVDVLDRFETDSEGQFLSAVMMDIRTPERTIRRWVFDRPQLVRDNLIDPETGAVTPVETDTGINVTYVPGSTLAFIAGPGRDELTLTVHRPDATTTTIPITTQEEIPVGGSALVVTEFATHSRIEERPLVVPRSQRRREFDLMMRMIRVELPGPPGQPAMSYWLPFHPQPVDSVADAPRATFYNPTRFTLSDGREIEMIYTRRRHPLPDPIVLERFDVEYKPGGFSGDATSVEEWWSVVRFEEDGGLTEPQALAVNKPAEHKGIWFFQKEWDPPRPGVGGGPPSPGLNHTVLGVANRRGVLIQLLGCIVAVIGMLYAFYVKPVIKRRHRVRVYEDVATTRETEAPEPAMAQ